MLEEYKGEKPDNVVGLEEHKKRPFYKKVSFWVLSALGLFFASCSIYGLVLGSQYVRAVTEAAHIIADANLSEEQSDVSSKISKGRQNVFNDLTSDVAYLDMGSLSWSKIEGENTTTRFIATNPTFDFPSNTNITAKVFCADYFSVSWTRLFYTDKSMAGTYSNANYIGVVDSAFNNSTANEFKQAVSGKMLYYYPRVGSSYPSVYGSGYQSGYEEGYDDARETYTNSTEVDFSVAAEMWPQDVTFTVSWYLDGTLEEQRSVVYRGSNGWSGFTFYREPLQVGRLVVQSDSNTPFWLDYSNEPFNDELHTPSSLTEDNAYDFDNQKWYIPSYWNDVYIRINGGSQPPSDLYDIYIDPNHNDRARVGLWSEGYDQGYEDGVTNYGGQYDNGYNAGYEDGRREGVTEGYNRGVQDGTTGGKALMNMFVTAFQQPFNQIYRFLNFNLLGINLLSLFTALLTLSVGIIIIKKVL